MRSAGDFAVGSSVAASSNYYGQPYYDGGYAPGYAPGYGYAPAPVYSAPVYSAPVYEPYYAPAPVYAAPTVVIGSTWGGGRYYAPRHHVYRHWDGHRH